MSQIIEVTVPDIGDFESVPVIELYVKVGDSIKVDDAICTLESDKATMDVPSTVAGVVTEVLVALGSKVGEGATATTDYTQLFSVPMYMSIACFVLLLLFYPSKRAIASS